jgi:beta-glucosidase
MSLRLLPLLLFVWLVSSISAQNDLLPYQNADLPIEERVTDLLTRMTLEEKIGQMTLIENKSVQAANVTKYLLGGVLSGGGGYPTGSNTAQSWFSMVNKYQNAALDTRLGIPLLYGVDAIHGHATVEGSVIFPHNIGLGAANNPELVEEIGQITASEMIATGIYWNYSPVLAVPQDIRWGRTYEGFSENTDIVTNLSAAMLRGLQGDDLSAPDTVLGTPKHFVGDGGTSYGTSPMDEAILDRGKTQVDEATLREVHLPPYITAIENGARSVMITHSSWGDDKMHGNAYLIQDVLRDELGFEGFIVSDWQSIDDVAGSYYTSVVQSVNAGIDMNMVPFDYVRFINMMKRAERSGDISMERIDEAVSNILRVKFELGLFERPFGDRDLQDSFGSDKHRAVARQAVSESLVLLKNENNSLPIDASAEQTVFITGLAADNLGIQSGGWTTEWQGVVTANFTEGTTIGDALRDGFSDNTTVHYTQSGRFDHVVVDPDHETIGIIIVGEHPYAEWFGDDETLTLPIREQIRIRTLREQVDALIVILLSGRPVLINDSIKSADAFVAAWLPGTEGAGVADVLFGDQDFTGKLPYTWLRHVNQLPFDFANLPTEGCNAPLFPYGYGLTYTSDTTNQWLELANDCR